MVLVGAVVAFGRRFGSFCVSILRVAPRQPPFVSFSFGRSKPPFDLNRDSIAFPNRF